ncbi:MAG: NADPH:quinone oxidoreductase family protein [Deltaproteobacteria bacterium]|nr:NADPH:quinone oxidoreductase family protein [Deltaproteobacteria bacterium]
MRAWQVNKHGEPEEVLQLVEKEVPEPGPGEIRIRVAAVSLGLPDVFMCRGIYPFQPQLPFTPGQEVVGVVTATGEGTHTAVGSRVMAVTTFFNGQGGFADQTLAQNNAVYRVPDEMPEEDAAAFLIQFQTAYLALSRRGQLAPGETLLVHGGAGGTGSAAIQVGRALGARVIATAGGSEKVRACRELGAHVAVDYNNEDFVEAVQKTTEGRGADVIFDPVGGDVFYRSLNCIANEGRLLAIGYAGGSWQNAPTQDIVLKNCSVVGVLAAFYDKEFLDREHEELLKLYAEGRIRPLVKQKIPFEEIPRALTDLGNRKVIGRVVAKL